MKIFIIANLICLFFLPVVSFSAEYHFKEDNLIGIDTKSDQKNATKVVVYLTEDDVRRAIEFLNECL